MRKKDLLAMKTLCATGKMMEAAREMETNARRTEYRYKKFFRAEAEGEILKVAVFLGETLRGGKREPDFEVYCSEKESTWMTYVPGEGKWRTGKIDNVTYNPYIHQSRHWQSDTDRKKVNIYFGTEMNLDIFEAVLKFQSEIRKEQLQCRHRREIEQIDSVMREVPEIPKDFERWVAKNCFRETLFFEPKSMWSHRGYPKMYCTHCRKWMDTLDWPDNPEHNKEGKCPVCGTEAVYKSWNKQKYVAERTDVGLLQRLRDDSGWILRQFECRINRNHEKGWEEYELKVSEVARGRMNGNFIEVEHFEYGEYKNTKVNRWCHLIRKGAYGYCTRESIDNVVMYTPNLKRELRGEVFGKMDMKRIMKGGERKRVDAERRLSMLKAHPYIEYLQKSGLDGLVEEIFNWRADMGLLDQNAKRIHEVLRLEKQRFERMKELGGGCRTLAALQHEQETGKRISDENIKFLEENKAEIKRLAAVVERTGMNMERTINYLRRQMEDTGQDYISLLRHYEDYLDMAEEFGMDITDEIVCRQQRMMEFHDQYAERKNSKKNRSRDREVDARYKNIRKYRKKNEERFEFETEELKIVVPGKASDITLEGRRQHHCVGASDTYISRMDEGVCFILFLRKKAHLDRPYYTLEVDWDGNIKQFYAAYDRQPEKEKIKKVLEAFTKKVKKREKEKEDGLEKVI